MFEFSPFFEVPEWKIDTNENYFFVQVTFTKEVIVFFDFETAFIIVCSKHSSEVIVCC